MAQLAKPAMREDELHDNLESLRRAGAGSPPMMLQELRRLRWVISTYGRLIAGPSPRRDALLKECRAVGTSGLFELEHVAALEREAPLDEVELEIFLRVARIRAERAVDLIGPCLFDLAARGLQAGIPQNRQVASQVGADETSGRGLIV
ncbi:hypothetical protein [Ferrovum sp.]|uniref:hypothetical protein n=1 Tax=Ferrovum sp. TaxID=2609467 RepID=UPI0026390319|nr:hypothetical protein [Ferrovum sp.]